MSCARWLNTSCSPRENEVDTGDCADDWKPEIIRQFDYLRAISAPMRRRILRDVSGIRRFLYQYRPVSIESGYLQKVLLDNQLWLSPVSRFNDPFDGRLAIDVSGSASEKRQALMSVFQR